MTKTNWTLSITDNVQVCVEPNIGLMTTYILLEQEDWFEQELHFLRQIVKPGMGIIDVGANHGVYALSLAKQLGGQGLLMAFEPATTPANLLQQSIEINQFNSTIKLFRLGLSDHEGQANLYLDTNSELNSLYSQSQANSLTETIRLTTLDAVIQSDVWPPQFSVDVLKLDAEGEEIRILNGGIRFFAEQDPLVMFEWKHGNIPNTGLLEAFVNLGMDCYRLVPGLSVLVPVSLNEKLDSYQLNLFACKPSRAARLRAAGRLITIKDLNVNLSPPTAHWSNALAHLPYVAALRADKQTIADWQAADYSQDQNWSMYEMALNAYLSALDSNQALSERWAWLKYSHSLLETLMTTGSLHLAALMLHIRVLYDSGLRAAAVEFNQSLARLLKTGLQARIDWPFLPLMPEYDQRIPQDSLDSWLQAQIIESLEKRSTYSSYFQNDNQWLQVVSDNPNCTPEIERRRILYALLTGKKAVIHAQSALNNTQPTPEHRNVDWWQNLTTKQVSNKILKSVIKFFANELAISPIYILDIGAASFGRFTEPYAELMQAGIAQVLGFEPDRAQCEKLNQIYNNNVSYRYLPQFVGSGQDTTFYETNWSMTGSLFKPNKDLLERFENLAELTTLQKTHLVKTTRIADLTEIQEIDLIKIDVQGAELEVFQGADDRLNEALVIWTEVEFVPLYENQPLFSEVELFLREKGFLLHSFDGIAGRRFKQFAQSENTVAVGRTQALWSDAIFVRDFRTIEQLSTLKLKKLAILLDQVVKAQDFCYEVLRLIDQRENSCFSADYLRILS